MSQYPTIEEYEAHKRMCGRSFEDLKDLLSDLKATLELKFGQLNDRLYKDNGTLSVQTVLRLHGETLKVLSDAVNELRARPRSVMAWLVSLASLISMSVAIIALIVSMRRP